MGKTLLVLILLCVALGIGIIKSEIAWPGTTTYVGMKACAGCHGDVVEKFRLTSHGRVTIEDEGEGCETCHGPGGLHSERGDKTKIQRSNWNYCYRCHSDKRMEFSLQYHHPVPEGRMGCNSCHSLHAPSEGSISFAGNEGCFKCHKEKRGPWVFEHGDVMREGCTTCHNPHGSINIKLLTERDYNLCLRCHMHSRYQSIGHYAHKRAINPASLGPRLTNCTGCHRAVHGSNYSREFRTE